MLAAAPGTTDTTGNRPGHADGAGPPGGDPVTYAGIVTRAIAIVLDVLVIDAVALLVTGAVLVVRSVFSTSSGKVGTVAAVIGTAAFILWVIVYFVSFWTTTGQTPGNRFMHIQVLRDDRRAVRPVQALVRLGAMLLSAPLFWGYWPILVSAKRRGVPDRLAGTVVVVDDAGAPESG